MVHLMAKRSWNAWTKPQLVLVRLGVIAVSKGKSIYSVVKVLQANPIMHSRSWESIRSKLNRLRKAAK